MNRDNARNQLRRVLDAYPSYREYLNDPVKVPDINATIDAWCDRWRDCEDQDIISVVDDIVSGEIEPRGEFETKDSLPTMIRSKAMRRKSDRSAQQRAVEQTQRRLPRSKREQIAVETAHLMQRARAVGKAVIDGKITSEDRDKELARLLSTATPIDELDGPRFKCLLCSDSGLVLIASPDVTQAARQHGVETIGRSFKTCMASCPCEEGDHFRVARRGWSPLRQYSAEIMCRVSYDSDRDALVAWLDETPTRLF